MSLLSNGEKMNKAELIEAVASTTGLTKTDTKKTIDAVFEEITNSLKKGEPVQLIGFGSFKVSERNARKGRNPRTGEVIRIAARKVPSFTAGQSLKDEVNKF